ncbi:uncharacterized protein LOC120937121 [Rana temporaria]|uniref:uncharacterized protein LOC120937121 n=1 Tax=Rana temporaria TaxID=8407 RepID=UPI001AAD8CA7|nr:uncharacterized protein LOC120930264 isoform X1 [Rana temporaria]XP_040206041.1 uncharacterized protein LOC120937121 [Rana temporaria]
MAASHGMDFDPVMEAEVPEPSTAAAAAATHSTAPPSPKKKASRRAASSRKRNITWTHIECQVLVNETLPCWMQLCGPRSRETSPQWKLQKWEEISKKVEEMYHHRRDPAACRKKFSDIKRSIVRKRRQPGRGGKRVSLLPHEADLLSGIGEDEITQLQAHQDRIKAQRRQKRRAEELESSSSSPRSAIQSEGETQEEEAEAATPTYRIKAQRRQKRRAEELESSSSSPRSAIQSEGETQEEEAEAATTTSTEAEQEVEEICPGEAAGSAGDAQDGVQQPGASGPGNQDELIILDLHAVDEDLDASGLAHHSSSPAVSPAHHLHHPSAASPNQDIPIDAGASSTMQQPTPGHAHSPEPCKPLRRIVKCHCQERQLRRLSHSLALHNRQQMRQYMALERYQRATRRMVCENMRAINSTLECILTKLEGNQSL